jgi:hypothetical protein
MLFDVVAIIELFIITAPASKLSGFLSGSAGQGDAEI